MKCTRLFQYSVHCELKNLYIDCASNDPKKNAQKSNSFDVRQ